MAKETYFEGVNFGAGTKTPTTYLNYAGLSAFWTKVKAYVDANDTALHTAVKDKINANDAAIRSYVESLEVNGVKVGKTPEEGLGTSLAVEIKGENITVGGTTGDYKDSKIDAAFNDVDGRLDAVELVLKENVVNTISVEDLPTGEADAANYVKFTKTDTGSAADGNHDVKLTIDETALDTKINAIDEKIVELEANAGVVGIRVEDTPAGEADDDNYVKFTIESAKFNDKSENTLTFDGKEYYKSMVTVKVDEAALDEKFASVDSTISTEIADRKEDVANLAGTKYTVADGTNAAAWDSSVKWNNITAIDEYLNTNESNLTALNDLTINGKQAIKVETATGSKQCTVTHTDVVLASGDILHNGTSAIQGSIAGSSISEILDDHENRIDALASATHFLGVTTTSIVDGSTTNKVMINGTEVTAADGDIVIVNNPDGDEAAGLGFSREYIFSNGTWYELGDTTAEANRLTAVETWINQSTIKEADITALFEGDNGATNAFPMEA